MVAILQKLEEVDTIPCHRIVSMRCTHNHHRTFIHVCLHTAYVWAFSCVPSVDATAGLQFYGWRSVRIGRRSAVLRVGCVRGAAQRDGSESGSNGAFEMDICMQWEVRATVVIGHATVRNGAAKWFTDGLANGKHWQTAETVFYSNKFRWFLFRRMPSGRAISTAHFNVILFKWLILTIPTRLFTKMLDHKHNLYRLNCDARQTV